MMYAFMHSSVLVSLTLSDSSRVDIYGQALFSSIWRLLGIVPTLNLRLSA
jgi:hypothetical protein